MLKSLFLGFVLATTPIVAMAGEYDSLIFEFTDGSTVKLPAENLQLSVGKSALEATSSQTSASIPLAKLSKFYFGQDATSLPITVIDAVEAIEVYTIAGVSVGHYESVEALRASVPAGVYVLKTAGAIFKIAIR